MSQPFDNRDWDERQIAEQDAEIERLKALCARAADALEVWDKWAGGNQLIPISHRAAQPLIAELRKAAE